MRSAPERVEVEPGWAAWAGSIPYSVGIEEEIMVLDPESWMLARDAEWVVADLPENLVSHARLETHQAVIELASSPHQQASEVAEEAAALRRGFAAYLEQHGLRAAGAGTHPLVSWADVRVSTDDRYQQIHESLRELARREPTFALHVHVGVGDAERATTLSNRLRTHLPLLLALSANSPYWQGRDSGLHSVRTPIFQAFPRTGIPRAFSSYQEYVEVVDGLLRTGAIPEPTFLWWDVRLQPSLGTVEVRVMDAQTTVDASAALLALVQTLAHLELEEGYADEDLIGASEVLDENRFLAARDGMDAELIDLAAGRKVPARDLLGGLMAVARDHAEDLGCLDALESIDVLAAHGGASWQRRLGESESLPEVVVQISDRFLKNGLS
jgi:glutamate---cysteine ligase / carboxylate-amine ligase